MKQNLFVRLRANINKESPLYRGDSFDGLKVSRCDCAAVLAATPLFSDIIGNNPSNGEYTIVNTRSYLVDECPIWNLLADLLATVPGFSKQRTTLRCENLNMANIAVAIANLFSVKVQTTETENGFEVTA